MDLDSFKKEYATQLAGLTSARVTTLWKKSKTMSRAELLCAIEHSMQAQIKDKQRRGKDVEPTIAAEPVPTAESTPTPTIATEPIVVESIVTAAAEWPKPDSPTFPDWSKVCEEIGVDHDQLKERVNELLRKLYSRGPDSQRKINELLNVVDDLLMLCKRRGRSVDVLGMLNV
jgi:hypothetical protein